MTKSDLIIRAIIYPFVMFVADYNAVVNHEQILLTLILNIVCTVVLTLAYVVFYLEKNDVNN